MLPALSMPPSPQPLTLFFSPLSVSLVSLNLPELCISAEFQLMLFPLPPAKCWDCGHAPLWLALQSSEKNKPGSTLNQLHEVSRGWNTALTYLTGSQLIAVSSRGSERSPRGRRSIIPGGLVKAHLGFREFRILLTWGGDHHFYSHGVFK